MKHATQTAFIAKVNSLQVAHESVAAFYRQILTGGHLHSEIGSKSLIGRVIDDKFSNLQSQETLSEMEQDQDIEPER